MSNNLISAAWTLLAFVSLILVALGYDAGLYVVGSIIMWKLTEIHSELR